MVYLLRSVQCAPAIRRPFQVKPELNLASGVEHIVHDAEVGFVTRLGLFLVKNNFMQPINFTNKRLRILLSNKPVILFQHRFHMFKFMSRYSFQQKSLILRVVKKRAGFAT